MESLNNCPYRAHCAETGFQISKLLAGLHVLQNLGEDHIPDNPEQAAALLEHPELAESLAQSRAQLDSLHQQSAADAMMLELSLPILINNSRPPHPCADCTLTTLSQQLAPPEL